MNAPDFVALHARMIPSRIAVIDAASRAAWTYGELDLAIAQAVAELKARGIRPGDRIAALARNAPELIVVHFACARLGAIYVPLSWRLSPCELRDILADAAPALLLGDRSLTKLGLTGEDLVAFASGRIRRAPDRSPPPPRDAPALILYTSGTQGRPKGVVLSQDNLDATTLNTAELCAVATDSVFLAEAPMFHIIGLILNVRPVLLRGGTVVVADGATPALTLERIADPSLGISHYFCVPQVAMALRNDPTYDPEKLGRLTALFTGGAPQPAERVLPWLADGIVAADGYGMTEIGTVLGMPLDPREVNRHAGAAGLTARRIECRIVDADGRECSVGEPGELIVRGPSVMQGYWGNSALTEQALTPDGWFRTGDQVLRDLDGYHWIVGRTKDMLISGGENIFPAEIERVLIGAPQVSESALVGVPDEQWGEVGYLFVSTHGQAPIDRSALLAFLGTKLARYKLPKYIAQLEALPKTGSGKILKRELRRIAHAALATASPARRSEFPPPGPVFVSEDQAQSSCAGAA